VGFLFYAFPMSFGLLKHFKDQKKGFQEQKEVSYVAHVILGSDLSSILKLLELRKNHNPEAIKLISNRLINKKLLIESYQYGVSQIRSEEAVTEIYKTHFNAKILPQKNSAQFYKDGKFHDFGGRAKSMDLLDGEAYFQAKGYHLEISSLFSEEDWANLDQIIGQHLDIRIVEGIEKTEAKDLVEKDEWLLTFKDYKKITCENLYTSLSPKKFIHFIKNKEKMTPELIDFCTSTKIQGALSLTWQMKKEFTQESRTFFIPQSMTHEWGHFIVEFENTNEGHLCHGLFLLHEEEPQSEDLASKIKLMKRVLDRVFTDFENNIYKEYIRFDDEMFISDVKDNLIEQLGFDYPTLKFLGQAAPVKGQFSQEKFLTRVLLS
jgi:hypothetical protein